MQCYLVANTIIWSLKQQAPGQSFACSDQSKGEKDKKSLDYADLFAILNLEIFRYSIG